MPERRRVALTAAQVAADATVLSNISNPSYTITLTDAGTPTLALTASQLAADAAVLSRISNSNYVITVVDTAANVSANIAALNSNTKVSTITLTDAGTALTLSVAQALGDTVALERSAIRSYVIAIVDTAANVSANIAALNADAKVSTITLTDVGTPTLALTAAQVVATNGAEQDQQCGLYDCDL